MEPDKIWTARSLADSAMCNKDTAGVVLKEHAGQIRQKLEKMSLSKSSHLGAVARRIRDAEAMACERMLALIERLTEQIENGDDLDAGELDKLAGLRAKYYKHIEAITGLDVVKAAAIRTLSDPGGSAMSWDGIEALEAVSFIVKEEPAALPAPRRTAKDLF
jgi:hypothetical protein